MVLQLELHQLELTSGKSESHYDIYYYLNQIHMIKPPRPAICGV